MKETDKRPWRYYFTYTISGVGKSPEEALDEALEFFSSDPALPEDIYIEPLTEEEAKDYE